MILNEHENKVIYLAAPYSAPDHKTEKMRFKTTCEVQAKLMTARYAVFSPLANSVPAVELGNLEIDHADFMRFDSTMLRRCDELLVLALESWRESKGIQEEIQEAIALRKPVLVIQQGDIPDLPYLNERCNVFGRSKILPYRK
ncbi:MAG: DUF1937 family protein [Planctomycetia bacterium]|nr:DUF1937 family protein [Planctomycetia bacterium]